MMEKGLSLEESDAISDQIKEALFARFDDLKDVYVIIEPDDERHRTQIEASR